MELTYSRFFEKALELTKISPEKFKKQYAELELRTLKGEISNENYQITAKKLLGNPGMTKKELENIVSLCWGSQVDDAVKLKKRIYDKGSCLGIFSNMNQFAWEYLSKKYLEMLKTYNSESPIIYSYLVKDVKPKLPMYKKAQKFAKENKITNTILIEDKESYLIPGIENFGWKGVLFTPYVDNAEAIRSASGHDDRTKPRKNFKIANSINELENALISFGVEV
ncbi:MAG: hypothetical protein KKG94_00970 [Nanoarchaeota archaeon]|nr:hypothetical protein [Nanoarchaeota archaeon]